jgi:hypothetical protein
MRSASASASRLMGFFCIWRLCLFILGLAFSGCLLQPTAFGADLVGMTFTRLERCPTNATSATQDTANCLQVPSELGQGELILAHGNIERKTSESLSQFVGDMPRGATIVLQSLGGDLMGGLRLGQFIRARGFNTYLPANLGGSDALIKDSKFLGKCISSCAYSFLGGTVRKVQANAQFGVHQFRAHDNGLDPVQTQKISAILGKYMDAMGVNRLLLDQALLTDPGKVTYIPDYLRLNWKVETTADAVAPQQLPKWKLESSAGGKRLAYSSRKQGASNAILTVALTPINGQMRVLLIVKPDPAQESSPSWLDYFKYRTDLQIALDGNSYVLAPTSEWARAGQVNTAGTQQIWFSAPEAMMQDIKRAKSFTVTPVWRELPKGLDSETVFGTEGLTEALWALSP